MKALAIEIPYLPPEFKDTGEDFSQKIRILNPRQFVNPGSVRFEKKESYLITVVHFCKDPSLLGCEICHQKSDSVFEFGFERVDHPLQFTTGASARVMDLNHNVCSLTNQ